MLYKYSRALSHNEGICAPAKRANTTLCSAGQGAAQAVGAALACRRTPYWTLSILGRVMTPAARPTGQATCEEAFKHCWPGARAPVSRREHAGQPIAPPDQRICHDNRGVEDCLTPPYGRRHRENGH